MEQREEGGRERRGCIKTSRGPWVVRRMGRDGRERTSLRRPSDQERRKNQQRERRRRMVAGRIFECLRAQAGFSLPKHSDQNDVLKALCEQAGWHVEEDGTIYRKRCLANVPPTPNSTVVEQPQPAHLSSQGPRVEAAVMDSGSYGRPTTNTGPEAAEEEGGCGISLELSLAPPCPTP
ncbi:hypothetical protein Taro_052755 [Colocasia esculenta]|uniref:Protein BZR1 homolog n=1 Tax=Colocasia esculenta TaxID=4460 RepID=A0A843XJE0_COLES|nr:hypothetical protein [Colocasia esculenta]